MSANGNNDQRVTIAGAITYAGRSVSNAQPVLQQPRQPRSLQGLLHFAMEATKAEDAPGNSQLAPMDEERRRFLEEALKSITVDVAKVLQDAIIVLTNTEKIRSIKSGQLLPDDVAVSFNNLMEYVDDIDIANDFYKIGGFAVFAVCYGSENEEVRARASGLLAELCQNNPFCQAKVMECGLLNILLNLVQSETGAALTKCLYALSCATREFPPACRELVAQGGCASLCRVLSAARPASRAKAAFLVRYLCHHYSDAKEQFIDHNVVKILAEQIKVGRDETSEHLLSVLVSLIEDSDVKVLQQCRDPAVGLKDILEDHLQLPELKDDTFAEEKEYCQKILHTVFDSLPRDPVEDVVDR